MRILLFKTSRLARLPLFLLCITFLQHSNAQNLSYVKGFSNSVPFGGNVAITDFAIDAADNRYITGYFTNTADFDPGPGTQHLSTVISNNDVFLAKYDAAGNYVWAKRIGGLGIDEASAIDVDAAGNCYVTGYFNATTDFDPGTGTANLTPVGTYDMFLAKYDANGNYVWAISIGNSGPEYGRSIEVDASGNSYVTGSFLTTVDFDPGGGIQNLTSAGGTDIFLAKYDAAGNYVWAKNMGGTGNDLPTYVTRDASDNYYITGSFTGIADFDPGAGTQNLTSAGATDIFLAKYDAAGNYIWANSIGGTGSETGSAIAVDATGNSFITGNFAGTADFDPDAGTQNLTSAGSTEIFLAKYDVSGNYTWAKAIGGANADESRSIAIDASGNSFITGYFTTSADFDPSVSIQTLTGTGVEVFMARYDATGNYVWAKNVGGSLSEIGYKISLDASGNILAGGLFMDVVDFDPGAGTVSRDANAGNYNGFLLQLNNSGDYVSLLSIGGYPNTALNDQGKSIKIDAAGNTYITGGFNGTIDFDPGAGTQNLTSAGSSDIFIAKYDASGNYVWAKNLAGTSEDVALNLSLDGSGNIFITGYFNNTVDFDPGPGTQNLTSAGGYEGFLAKYDADGNYIWAIKIGGSTNDYSYAVGVDALGNSYITGFFSTVADFDPGAAVVNLAASGGNDIFLAKYDAAGNYVWAKRMGGGSNDQSTYMAVDAAGSSYITGYFAGTVDFDPDAGTANIASAGSNDIFMAKYDASGNYVWAKRMGGVSLDDPYGIALDGTGNIYLAGGFLGTADFDPGAGVLNLVSSGTYDAFLGKYNASGDLVWATKVGGAGADFFCALTVDALGNIYTTGYFGGTSDFDPGAGTQNLTSSGGADIVLAKYDAAGNYVWAKNMGGPFDDIGFAIAVDATGNSYITGYFNNVADFDPNTGVQNLTSLNSYDLFFAKYGDPITLPVKLESFTGQFVDNGSAILLRWTTAVQDQHSYFEIERRNAAGATEAIGRVAGCGTCYGQQQYSFKDNKPLSGYTYYRLRMVDIDGREEYSKWISFHKDGRSESLTLYPTITTGTVTASYDLTGAARTIRINITDAGGRMVQQKQVFLANGTNPLRLDLSAQASGIYYVQLMEQDGSLLATGIVIRK
jgi:uncharacterized protein (DUF2249 family)